MPSKLTAAVGSRIEPWRLLLAVMVVAAVAAVLWLWGRPPNDPPQADVVVTNQYWPQGAEPTGFQLVRLPADIAARFVDPLALVGKVAAVDIPPGVYVSASQLTDKFPVGNDGNASDNGDNAGGPNPNNRQAEITHMNFAADFSAWPLTPPSAGDWAVIATKKGGCALHVLRLAGVAGGAVVLAVDPGLAAELAEITRLNPLVLWKSPAAGWPACRGGRVAPFTDQAAAPSDSAAPSDPAAPADLADPDPRAT